MDALEKGLSEELARDMAAKNQAARPNGNPSTIRTVRLTEQIDTLTNDFRTRIAMLEKIKESL